MHDVDYVLTEVRKMARGDAELARKILSTRDDANPVRALCELVTGLGFPLYEMDLVNAGEEYYANMRRSTNGGGENSPLLDGADDYYEMFMADIERI
ncbi:MAG: hypothetical protein Q4G47_03815 [Lachnospiraceae bacterium]|nr:hypothetical protein [Lachnospiraceae bacterium]